MKTQKKVGIWMDHLNANLIDVEATDRNRTITSKFMICSRRSYS
jgi:hypothetical protein